MIETLEINLCLLCGCLPHVKRPFKIICCCICRHRRKNKNRNRKPQTPEAPRHDNVGLFGPQPRQPRPIAMRDLGNRRHGVVFRSLPRTIDDNPTLTFERDDNGNAMLRRVNGNPPTLVGPRLANPPPDFDMAVAMDRLQRSSSRLAMTSSSSAAAAAPQSPPKTPKTSKHHQQGQQKSPRLPRSPGSMNMVALRYEAEVQALALARASNGSPRAAASGGSEE